MGDQYYRAYGRPKKKIGCIARVLIIFGIVLVITIAVMSDAFIEAKRRIESGQYYVEETATVVVTETAIP